jgi:hypothetical protein
VAAGTAENPWDGTAPSTTARTTAKTIERIAGDRTLDDDHDEAFIVGVIVFGLLDSELSPLHLPKRTVLVPGCLIFIIGFFVRMQSPFGL